MDITARDRGEGATASEKWLPHAEAGDADALFNLAQTYRLGRGVPADPERATALYRQAAAQGHVAAASSYAVALYAAGREAEAMPLLQAAAQGGDAKARYLVGLAHFNGDWLPRDWPRAYALVSLAARTGVPAAHAALGRIETHLDPEEKEESLALIDMLSVEALSGPAARQEIRSLVPALAPAGPAQTPASTAAANPPKSQRPLAVDPRPNSAAGVVLRLGAFAQASNAHALRNRLRAEPSLTGREIALHPAGRLTLVTVRRFHDSESARATCRDLRAKGYECVVAR
jgi:cell division septation protein DedD